jgi:hypothetical protein
MSAKGSTATETGPLGGADCQLRATVSAAASAANRAVPSAARRRPTRRGAAPAGVAALPVTAYTASGRATFLRLCMPSGVSSIPAWFFTVSKTGSETATPPGSAHDRMREATFTPSP